MVKPPESRPLYAAARGRRSQIQILREAAGLSRVELARRADLAHSIVYLLEDGLLDGARQYAIKAGASAQCDGGMLMQDMSRRHTTNHWAIT